MIELPYIVVKGCIGIEAVVVHRTDRVERHRFPTIVVDGPGPQHLEVLGQMRPRERSAFWPQERSEAGPVDVRLVHSFDLGRRRHPDEFEHAR